MNRPQIAPRALPRCLSCRRPIVWDDGAQAYRDQYKLDTRCPNGGEHVPGGESA